MNEGEALFGGGGSILKELEDAAVKTTAALAGAGRHRPNRKHINRLEVVAGASSSGPRTSRRRSAVGNGSASVLPNRTTSSMRRRPERRPKG